VVAGLENWRLIIFGSILAFVVVAAPEGLQARLRVRPRLALGAFVVLAGGSVLVGVSDELLDAISIGAVGAAAVALWPGPSRRPVRQAAPIEAVEAAEAVIPIEATSADGDQPATPAPIVECTELSRYFGGVRALDGLTLTITEGELVGLVGPNGSGKTTLVNLLSRTFRPTRGKLRVVGEDITGLAPHRVAHAGVARTYQIPRPFTSMTVRDNVAMAIMFGRDPRPIVAARQAAQAHLDFVHLTRLADAYPAEINLHERQLLEMARAIASSPRILLLDEALAGLNPAEIDNAVEVVRRIHQSGITIVIVEHLLRVVNQLATRVVVLDRGRLLAEGEPQTVMREPAVVTAYLGKHAHA
jgi:branched-chain amino acid transport system permease protein